MTTADLATLQAAAHSALAREDWPAAERALGALIKVAPGNVSLHYNRGLVRKRMGDAEPALADFEVALGNDPEHANARFEHAATLLDLGRLTEAETGFRAYLESVPDDADAVVNLARILLRVGQSAAARDLLDVQAPGLDTVDLARAEAARDCGDIDTALALLSRVEAGNPDMAVARLKIATQGPTGRITLDPAQFFTPRR